MSENTQGFADDVQEAVGERLRVTKAGAQTAVTGVGGRFYNVSGRSQTVKNVHVAVGVAPTGAALIVDVNKNGTTIFATGKPTVAISAFVAQAAPPTAVELADGDYLTVDVDQIGSTVAGSDLVVTVELA